MRNFQRYLRLLPFSVFVFLLLPAKAQFFGPCSDSTRLPQPTYSCPVYYDPVCACDGNTYRNDCAAYYQAGLNNFNQGSCTGFDIYFTPNIVTYSIDLNFYVEKRGVIYVTIFDALGYRKLEDVIYASEGVTRDYYFDVNRLDRGIYLMQFIKDGQEQVKKILKLSR